MQSTWNSANVTSLVIAVTGLVTAIGGVIALFKHVRGNKP